MYELFRFSAFKLTDVGVGNRKDAFGLERAKNAQIPTTYHNIVRFRKKNSDDLDTAKREFDAECVDVIFSLFPSFVQL